ncbi:hypothetical protein [Desulfobacula phenolica]|uniref:Uncharacterized protein n=1 Tax=Desulfobacula phenolica TaxID=90732 RepID=A0A1H2H4U1_9BACT|nr:hypothetical protein [Desulfobacula phenolica]SDU26598.1 hypothetical protein SAMN04487931_10636 [Desulfobacula phenolica]
MANFPDIAVCSGFTEADIGNRLMETSSAGYTMIRGRGTAVKKEFILDWKLMTSADKNTLQSFFNTYYGQSFIFTHPETGIDYTVCFQEDKLNFKYKAKNRWLLTLKLKEM